MSPDALAPSLSVQSAWMESSTFSLFYVCTWPSTLTWSGSKTYVKVTTFPCVWQCTAAPQCPGSPLCAWGTTASQGPSPHTRETPSAAPWLTSIFNSRGVVGNLSFWVRTFFTEREEVMAVFSGGACGWLAPLHHFWGVVGGYGAYREPQSTTEWHVKALLRKVSRFSLVSRGYSKVRKLRLEVFIRTEPFSERVRACWIRTARCRMELSTKLFILEIWGRTPHKNMERFSAT